jgi:hypothetical protein
LVIAQQRLGHYLAHASSLLVMTPRDGISFISTTELPEKPNFGKIFLHQGRLIAILIISTSPSSSEKQTAPATEETITVF